MIAPSRFPQQFVEWNRSRGAPFGFRANAELKKYASSDQWLRMSGPFALQSNNTSRAFEYPWAYYAACLEAPASIAEIGGSLSGFQFALSRDGHRVLNIDPGIGWPSGESDIARLNRVFGTDVRLVKSRVIEADLAEESLDTVFAISVLEHLSDAELREVMPAVARALKPGGLFVITVDLFLNLTPFTRRAANRYGENKNICVLVRNSGLEMISGTPEQLYGFPGFDALKIQERLEDFLVGSYPVLVQCLVLRKPPR